MLSVTYHVLTAAEKMMIKVPMVPWCCRERELDNKLPSDEMKTCGDNPDPWPHGLGHLKGPEKTRCQLPNAGLQSLFSWSFHCCPGVGGMSSGEGGLV